MRNNYVTMYRTDRRVTFQPAGHKLRAHGRLAWLHHLLWRALQKLNALADVMDEKVEAFRLPISNDEVFERILESRHDLFDNYRKPSRILIGPETMADLTGCEQIRSWDGAFQFTARAGFGRTLFDLPIEVVPQMEGVVVLCDDAMRV